MGAKQSREKAYPDVSWFFERNEGFKETWANHHWHENGERTLKPIMQSIRKYSSHINQLPDNFLPSVFDQHLAVLSEGYEYQVLDILSDLGEDRFICENETGETFCLWSRALAETFKHGAISVMTAVIRLGEDTEGFVPAITYGPLLEWKSLFAEDFILIARELARDLLRLKGLSAVIRRNPAPFWALWTLGNIPRIMHGAEEVYTCWYEGSFTGTPDALLKGAWKKTTIGKRIRWQKPGSKPFFEQTVIWDEKTSRGIILARRGSYLEKLKDSLSSLFTPDSEEPFIISPTLEMAFSDIVRKELPYLKWTRAFDQQDNRKDKEWRERHPEQKAELDVINAALEDLLPYINSKTEPDWKAFAKEHGLEGETLESLKSFYTKYQK
jgi:hypothetical protein